MAPRKTTGAPKADKAPKATKPSKATQKAMDQAEADQAKAEGGNGVSSTAIKDCMKSLEKSQLLINDMKAKHKRELAQFSEDQKKAKHRAKIRGVPMVAFNLVWAQRKLELKAEAGDLEIAEKVIRPMLGLEGTPLGQATLEREAETDRDLRPRHMRQTAAQKAAILEGKDGIKKLPDEPVH